MNFNIYTLQSHVSHKIKKYLFRSTLHFIKFLDTQTNISKIMKNLKNPSMKIKLQ